jgi:hypothetical protein
MDSSAARVMVKEADRPDVPTSEEDKAAGDVPTAEEEKAAVDVPKVQEDKTAAEDGKAAPEVLPEEKVPCAVCRQLPGTIIDFSEWVNEVARHKCSGCGEMRDYFQRSPDGSSTYSEEEEEEDQGSDLDRLWDRYR